MSEELTEQMEQMSIQSPVESVGAWDAIYSYMYPELKRQHEIAEHMYSVMSLEESVLRPDEQEREINRYRNEMMRVIQVRRMLRRLAGYRH